MLLPTLDIRDSVETDILPIADNMRAADVQEVYDSHQWSPFRALANSYRYAEVRKTVLFDLVPVAMFGVCTSSLLSGKGSPWFLGTEAVVKYPRAFLEGSKEHVECLKVGYTTLENMVSVENTASLRWLKYLGFIISDQPEYTATGAEFRRFYMEIE